MMRCRFVVLCALTLVSLPQALAAKSPMTGGPRQFDLICRGQVRQVVDEYLPAIVAGFPGMSTKYPVRRHIIVDLIGMRYQQKPPFYTGAPPDKVAELDENWGVVILDKDARTMSRWAIRLRDYRSTRVSEDPSGAIWLERMTCRLAPYSGFPK